MNTAIVLSGLFIITLTVLMLVTVGPDPAVLVCIGAALALYITGVSRSRRRGAA